MSPEDSGNASSPEGTGRLHLRACSTFHPVYTLVGSSLSWSGPRGGRKTERHYPGEPSPRPHTSKKGSSCSIWLVAESVASFLHGPQGAGPEGSSEGSSSGPEWPHLHGRHRTAGRPHPTSPTKTPWPLRVNGLKARCVRVPPIPHQVKVTFMFMALASPSSQWPISGS